MHATYLISIYFANADKAADMLDQGGVVVGNAATLRKDGTVDLEISHKAHNPDGSSAPDVVTGSASRPGVWVDGFFPLAMSKETAQSLGLTAFRYVGDMVQFADAPGWRTLDKLRSIIDDRLPLVNGTSQSYRYSWGTGDPSGMVAELLPFAVVTPDVDVSTLVQRQRVSMQQLLHDVTRARRQTDGDDLAARLVLDHRIFITEAELRWLETLDEAQLRIARTHRASASMSAATSVEEDFANART